MYEPTLKHQRLVKKMLKLLLAWMPHTPFLWEWEIEVAPIKEIEGHEACMAIQYSEYNLHATLIIAESALELSEYELEEGLLHEMCHILVHELSMVFNNELKTLGGDPKYEHSAWQDAEERACWRFARMHMLRKAHEDKNRN